VKTIENMSK